MYDETWNDNAEVDVSIKVIAAMRKLFRWHRGGLEESLATTVEVSSFSEVEAMITGENGQGFPEGYFSNVRTSFCGHDSARCGEEWDDTYYVIADTKKYKDCVVGMCNFSAE